jgi:hypothetical protein
MICGWLPGVAEQRSSSSQPTEGPFDCPIDREELGRYTWGLVCPRPEKICSSWVPFAHVSAAQTLHMKFHPRL